MAPFLYFVRKGENIRRNIHKNRNAYNIIGIAFNKAVATISTPFITDISLMSLILIIILENLF